MDEELDALADELKRLRPAELPPRLGERVARELAPVAGARRRVWWIPAVALPMAAVLAVIFNLSRRETARPAPPAGPMQAQTADEPPRDVFKPVAAENVLYAATDEGLVTLPDGAKARRERLKFVDTITWQNPQTHASLTWSIPREEVRIVPVRYE